jgi:hypothetical protein
MTEDEAWDDLERRQNKCNIKDDDDIQEYKKPWVGLTDEEIDKAIISTAPSFKPDDVARAIEAKLKERNT